MLLKQGKFDPKKGFTRVPNQIIFTSVLSPIEARVYCALLAFDWNDKHVVWPSVKALSELTNTHRATVYRALQRLEGLGFLGIERSRNKRTCYHLLVTVNETH